MRPTSPLYLLFAFLLASFSHHCAGHITAAPQVIHKISTNNRVVQVLHSVETTLPVSTTSCEYSAEETKTLKKLFAKPQPHATLQNSKAPASQRLMDILSKRTPTTIRVVFNEDGRTKELYLSFKFGYESIGRSLVPGTTITVISTKALEPWQRELLATIIKVDSTLIRKLLIAAGGIIGLGIKNIMEKPARYRAQRQDLSWLESLQDKIRTSTSNDLPFEEEIYQARVKIVPGKSYAPSLQRIYDSSWPRFDTSGINIPKNSLVAIIYVPCPGAISALINDGKLKCDTTKNQIRILAYPAKHSWDISSELSKYAQEIDKYQWSSSAISEYFQATDFVLLLERAASKASLKNSPRAWGDEHYALIKKISTRKTDCVIHYPLNSSGSWKTLGNVDASTSEIVFLPMSLIDLVPITHPGLGDNVYNPTHPKFPKMNENIAHRTLVIINDQFAPFSYLGSKKIRHAYELLALTKENDIPRFSSVFMNMQPTSSSTHKCIHYTVVIPPTDTATMTGRLNPSVCVHHAQTATDSALECVYQAVAQHDSNVPTPGKPTFHFDEEEDAQRHREEREKEQKLIEGIVWTSAATITDEFARFEEDIWATIQQFEGAPKQDTLRATSGESLPSILPSLPVLEGYKDDRLYSSDEIASQQARNALALEISGVYRLLFTHADHCGNNRNLELHPLLNGRHLIVWEKQTFLTKLTAVFL